MKCLEATVLYTGSSWDIYPEGNLDRETIGNKAKSFKRHQRALLWAGWWSWAAAKAVPSTSSAILPLSRSFSAVKQGKGNGARTRMRPLTPFTQRVYCHCAAHILSLCHVPICHSPRVRLFQGNLTTRLQFPLCSCWDLHSVMRMMRMAEAHPD